MFCPNCGVENPETAALCRRCRAPLHEGPPEDAPAEHVEAEHVEANAAGAICSRCETFNEPGVERCTTCGYPLGGTVEVAQEEPAEHAAAEHPDAPLEHAAPHIEEAPAHDEQRDTPAAPYPAHQLEQPEHAHEDDGQTHALEPVSHDTPAEGNPSIAEELSALELSPEDARAARGEDATPPDGVPAVMKTDQTRVEPPTDEAPPAPAKVDPRTAIAAAALARGAAPSRVSFPPAVTTPPSPRRAVAPPAAAPPPPAPAPAVIPPPPAPAPAAEKICASCSSANLPNAKFCAECGTPFPKKAAAPVAPAPPPAPDVPQTREHEAPVESAPPHVELLQASHGEDAQQEPPPAESLHEAMQAALVAHGDAQEHGDPAHEEPAAQLPEDEPHPEQDARPGFDPTKTDQTRPEELAEHEHTSEQPRVALAGAEAELPARRHDLEAASDASDPGGAEPLSFEQHELPGEHLETELPASAEPAHAAEEEPAASTHEEAPLEHTPPEAAPALDEQDAHAFNAEQEESTQVEPAPQDPAAEAEGVEVAEEPLPEHEGAESAQALAAELPEQVSEEEPAAAELPAEEPVAAPPPYTVMLVVEKGEHAGTAFQLAALENSIGGAGAAIELNEDVYLAPHHATVLFEEDRLLLRDEGAANGVYLKLRIAGSLEPGDQFIAGQRLLRFDGPVELPAPEGELPFQGAPRPAGGAVRVVELLAGGKQGRTCHRSGPVIAIGKTGCDLNFGSDALLAPRHAEIHLAEDGSASLVDLGAVPEGVLLRVRQGATIELQAGDVLQLGGQTLRIEFEQPASG